MGVVAEGPRSVIPRVVEVRWVEAIRYRRLVGLWFVRLPESAAWFIVAKTEPPSVGRAA